MEEIADPPKALRAAAVSVSVTANVVVRSDEQSLQRGGGSYSRQYRAMSTRGPDRQSDVEQVTPSHGSMVFSALEALMM